MITFLEVSWVQEAHNLEDGYYSSGSATRYEVVVMQSLVVPRFIPEIGESVSVANREYNVIERHLAFNYLQEPDVKIYLTRKGP